MWVKKSLLRLMEQGSVCFPAKNVVLPGSGKHPNQRSIVFVIFTVSSGDLGQGRKLEDQIIEALGSLYDSSSDDYQVEKEIAKQGSNTL